MRRNFGFDFEDVFGEITRELKRSLNPLQGFRMPSYGLRTRDMNFEQASHFKGLPMFGDIDKDGVPNLFDCKPYDVTRQGLTVLPIPKGKGISYFSQRPNASFVCASYFSTMEGFTTTSSTNQS